MDGKGTHPDRWMEKRIVLESALGIEGGAETHGTREIKEFHKDFAMIRRHWLMHHLMYRENGIGERNPPDRRAKPE